MSDLASNLTESDRVSRNLDPTIVVDNVVKTYAIGRGGSEDLKNSRMLRGRQRVEALKGVSMVVSPGESVGIMGLNGSGKSTLLRLISGGEEPTTGRILVKSRPTLMGVAPALQRDLTGEQNIYLGCLALGMSPAEAREQIGIIAEWTELGEAIHRPMGTYSSGMGARLNFAISTSVNPEILLVDEALSTGDAAFGAKAEQRIGEVIDKAGNLLLVSHDIRTIEKLCDRAVWIHKGEVIEDGPMEEISPLYHEWARLLGKEDKAPAYDFLEGVKLNYSRPAIFFTNSGGG
ncbi:Teichoic acids export ATP-binding protein TagH [Corynebacterium glaucum]|uniref:Teichoic acids export ATP-binding protein TagH n=1 Tax=Corynebacterium glaucum TaxID=187491 RepID=A0A1Q2HY88_9CORY|nr:ABC transporter ATP-binding protein [Corynebacterium glaucum]AQQ15789.1 Teichoic acids export ATP-binding protein TagH [Corynebacterium glaucum]WJZ08276.1 Teichoic acids export ATP-binding protein TagH [Corynebacterium glaucum]